MTDSFPLYFSYFVDLAFLVINKHKNAHGKPTDEKKENKE
jgi:hypothetical protein